MWSFKLEKGRGKEEGGNGEYFLGKYNNDFFVCVKTNSNRWHVRSSVFLRCLVLKRKGREENQQHNEWGLREFLRDKKGAQGGKIGELRETTVWRKRKRLRRAMRRDFLVRVSFFFVMLICCCCWCAIWWVGVVFVCLSFSFSSGYRLAIRRVVGIDKREAPEFVLINGAHNVVVDGRQNRIFLGKLAVKV